MTMRRIVVVGNGIAGLTACDSLRSAGFDGELTVVGAERHHPVQPPRPVQGAAARVTARRRPAQPTSCPQPTHEATELLGVSATGLDVDARLVRLDGGGELPYDGLVIASGSRAKRLAPGAREPRDDGSARELTLRTIEDAIPLESASPSRPSVIVVGGGPLGMEVASGCLHAGCDVTLVSDVRRSRASWAAPVRDIHLRRLRRGLRSWRGKARLVLRRRDAGRPGRRPTWRRIVVTAVGDEPNIELAGRLSGLLGRVAAGRHPRPGPAGDRGRRRRGVLSRQPRRATRPLWTSAIDQGKVAAVGLLHGDAATELNFQPYFWTEEFGLSLKAAGTAAGCRASPWSSTGRGARCCCGGRSAAVAVNYRIPVPRLRRLCEAATV